MSKYVCEGSCHGQATEEQYNEGLTKCGMKDCDHYDQPLVKKED